MIDHNILFEVHARFHCQGLERPMNRTAAIELKAHLHEPGVSLPMSTPQLGAGSPVAPPLLRR